MEFLKRAFYYKAAHPEFIQLSVTKHLYPKHRLMHIQSHNQITNNAS